MIKDSLSRRNQNKRVIARRDNISIVELPDRVDASGIVHFRFAIARTDNDGNGGEDGIILSIGDLMELPNLINGAAIRESASFAEYSAEHADKPRAKTLLW